MDRFLYRLSTIKQSSSLPIKKRRRLKGLTLSIFDLIEPVDVVSKNCKYILTNKDRRMGYIVTTLKSDKRAMKIKDAVVQSCCSYFGKPQVVLSDNEREFSKYLLTDTFIQLRMDHRSVLPYSPPENGFIERQHKTINQTLWAVKAKTKWALILPIIIASTNSTSIKGSLYTSS